MSLAKLKQDDCIDLIPALPDKYIDALITDPPYFYLYGISWDNQWRSLDEYALWLKNILTLCKPKLKDNATVYIFSSQENSDIVSSVCREVFHHMTNIVWLKQDAAGAEKGVSCGNIRSPVSRSERITLCANRQNPLGDRIRELLTSHKKTQTDLVKFCTGKKTGLVGLWLTDKSNHGACEPTQEMWSKICKFFDVPNDYDTHHRKFDSTMVPYDIIECDYVRGQHPCEKPVILMELLVKSCTDEEATVFDPFMGSGTTGVACMNTNRNFIGIERDDKYFAIAKQRIEEARQANQPLIK